MTEKEITTVIDRLNRLHSSGEAIAVFAAGGGVRETIFRALIAVDCVTIDAFERDVCDARDTVKPIRDPKVAALMDEMVNLTQRMIQLEAALPLDPPDMGELNLAGIALYLGSGTLWNYLGRFHVENPHALSQPELMEWCKWNGATNGDDNDAIIDKVTRHLSTLCPAPESTAPRND